MFSKMQLFTIVFCIGICQLLLSMQGSNKFFSVLIKGTILGTVLGLFLIFGYEGFKDIVAEIVSDRR
ncbi:hypothetical protein CON90_30335 [Bacillus toyonensis]|nr:hypothetical protein CON90_30335 [Bacillus toyonensis]